MALELNHKVVCGTSLLKGARQDKGKWFNRSEQWEQEARTKIQDWESANRSLKHKSHGMYYELNVPSKAYIEM